MTFKTWLLFLAMETALSLSPGPAVFYVVSQGVRGALRRTLPAAAGIIGANAIYFTLSATSLGAIIAASARFFAIAKWAGAAYLIYLGVKALRSRPTSETLTCPPNRGRSTLLAIAPTDRPLNLVDSESPLSESVATTSYGRLGAESPLALVSE